MILAIFAMLAYMVIFDKQITDQNLWTVGAVGLVVLVLSGFIPDWHDEKREESADVFAERQAINSKIEKEWWKIKAGNGDRGEVERLEAKLRAFNDGTEIAPGDGVYLRKKRK